MSQKFTNFAEGTLEADIADSDLSLTISSTDAAKFPVLTSPDYFIATLFDGVQEPEIIKITATSSGTFTIVRAQESTTARDWSAGTRLRLAATASVFEGIGKADTIAMITWLAVLATGSTDAYKADYTPAVTALVVGQHYSFIANAGNTGPATLSINGLTPVTIVKGVSTPLSASDISTGQVVDCVYDGTNLVSNIYNAPAPTSTFATLTVTGAATMASAAISGTLSADATTLGSLTVSGATALGVVTATTPDPGDNTTKLATTAWVTAAIANFVTSSALTSALSAYALTTALSAYLTTSAAASTYAPKVSPTFTGNAQFVKVGIGKAPSNVLDVVGTGNTAICITGDNYVGVAIKAYRTSAADHAMINMYAARGSASSPTTIVSGDIAASFVSYAYDGTANQAVGAFRFTVEGTVGSGHTPGLFTLLTANASGSNTERLRVDSSGRLYLNTTSSTDDCGLAIQHNTVHANIIATTITAGTGTIYHLMFRNGNGQVGAISTNGSNTTYATTSDKRLKEKAELVKDAGSIIDSLKVYSYDWKDGGKGVGLFAQELHQHIPQAVVKGDDNELASKSSLGFRAWGVDLNYVVPYLIAAMQDIRARVSKMEAKT